MKALIVKGVALGEGRPKICLPLTGRTEEELICQAEEAVKESPDLLEWRADFFEKLEEKEAVRQMCTRLGERIGQIPLIFTVRTEREGGNFSGFQEAYVELLEEAAKNREIDLMDVELFWEASVMERLICKIQQMGKKVIASNHHFEGTPKQAVLEEILRKMEESPADVRKLAVMPRKEEEVLELLSATLQGSRTGEKPLITMSMGKMGAVSRISGELFGSCVTFGTAGQESAPGQIGIRELRSFLRTLQQENDR